LIASASAKMQGHYLCPASAIDLICSALGSAGSEYTAPANEDDGEPVQ